METKHTQGKWEIEKSDLVHDLLIIGDGKLIGRVKPEDSTDEEFQSNAKLIAAAPDLLDVLMILKPKLELLILPKDRESNIYYQTLCKAINKATK